MKKGSIKRLFPGGNTAEGFYSYYQYVIDLKEASRVYLLKGGPGVGKSQLMKNIGSFMVDRGYDVEFHHCSADPESLDAIVINALGVAFIDGTAPHVIDPKYPGAVEEILHLGQYWNQEALVEDRQEIIKAIDANGKIYKRVYKYLKAVRLIQDDLEWIYQEAANSRMAATEIEEFISKIVRGHKKRNSVPKERHLFGSAYTFHGHIHYAETYLASIEKRFVLLGSSLVQKTRILNKIAEKFLEKGLMVEFYHHPMDPKWIETITVPEIGLAVTGHGSSTAKRVIDMDDYLEDTILKQYHEEIQTAQKYVQELLNQVFEQLKKTKMNHDYIEAFYSPNVRFQEIDQLVEGLKKKIINMK